MLTNERVMHLLALSWYRLRISDPAVSQRSGSHPGIALVSSPHCGPTKYPIESPAQEIDRCHEYINVLINDEDNKLFHWHSNILR